MAVNYRGICFITSVPLLASYSQHFIFFINDELPNKLMFILGSPFQRNVM